MHLVFTIKKTVKIFLLLFEKVVPQTVCNKFYEFLLPKYKAIVRSLYRLKGITYLLIGNKEGVKIVEAIYQIMPYTLVGIGGLEATYNLSKMMNERGIGGNFVELGVARGGCAALMGGVAFNNSNIERHLWLFDSFEGLPDPTKDDFSKNGICNTGEHIRPLPKGACLGTLGEVQELLLNKLKYPADKISFVKGWFQDTLPVKGKDIDKIAVLRIDGDWYESTKCCLEHLYDQVVDGGAVIIDDYHSCFGCKKAVDEFISKRNIRVNMTFDGRGGCYFVKP